MSQSLRERLSEEMKLSLKNKETKKTGTIRMIIAAIKDQDILLQTKGQPSGLSESEIPGLLQKMIKQRRDSIQLYEQGDRLDLAQQERNEIDIISSFLPKQFSDGELNNLLRQLITTQGITGPKDFGKVMSVLKNQYPGQIDMTKAGALLKQFFA